MSTQVTKVWFQFRSSQFNDGLLERDVVAIVELERQGGFWKGDNVSQINFGPFEIRPGYAVGGSGYSPSPSFIEVRTTMGRVRWNLDVWRVGLAFTIPLTAANSGSPDPTDYISVKFPVHQVEEFLVGIQSAPDPPPLVKPIDEPDNVTDTVPSYEQLKEVLVDLEDVHSFFGHVLDNLREILK